jgi:hypothetical protein
MVEVNYVLKILVYNLNLLSITPEIVIYILPNINLFEVSNESILCNIIYQSIHAYAGLTIPSYDETPKLPFQASIILLLDHLWIPLCTHQY